MSVSEKRLAAIWLKMYLHPQGGDGVSAEHKKLFTSYAEEYFYEANEAFENGLFLAATVTAFAGFEATAKAYSSSSQAYGEAVFTEAIKILNEEGGPQEIKAALEIIRSVYNKNSLYRIANEDPYRNAISHGDLGLRPTKEYTRTLIYMMRTLTIVMNNPEHWESEFKHSPK